jgi:uracil-DNA glycosylase
VQKPYFLGLREQLRQEYNTYKIYPKPEEIFKAFQLTPFEKVRVVILGQDPFPFGDSKGKPHAHGLAFSSPSTETPASLRWILREVDRDVVKTKSYEEFRGAFPNNDLTPWANQGVLLLNTSLTVRAGVLNSHKGMWEDFIVKVLHNLWGKKEGIVFLLWGSEAKAALEKAITISDSGRDNLHKILQAGHPATASKGKDLFSGNGHFSKTNYYFWRQGLTEIDWKLNGF